LGQLAVPKGLPLRGFWPVEAPVWNFAGAWTGFTDILSDFYLVLVGVGVSASDIRLDVLALMRIMGLISTQSASFRDAEAKQ
jgi:hypothetical protein